MFNRREESRIKEKIGSLLEILKSKYMSTRQINVSLSKDEIPEGWDIIMQLDVSYSGFVQKGKYYPLS